MVRLTFFLLLFLFLLLLKLSTYFDSLTLWKHWWRYPPKFGFPMYRVHFELKNTCTFVLFWRAVPKGMCALMSDLLVAKLAKEICSSVAQLIINNFPHQSFVCSSVVNICLSIRSFNSSMDPIMEKRIMHVLIFSLIFLSAGHMVEGRGSWEGKETDYRQLGASKKPAITTLKVSVLYIYLCRLRKMDHTYGLFIFADRLWGCIWLCWYLQATCFCSHSPQKSQVEGILY